MYLRIYLQEISLAPHKNIPPRVAINTNNRNSIIAISLHSLYSMDRGIHLLVRLTGIQRTVSQSRHNLFLMELESHLK